MPEPVSITTAHESVEVDLWGAVFHTQRVTRSLEKEIARLEKAAEAVDPGDIDAEVRLLVEMLDVLLVPEDGKRKKASAHIIEKWEADEITRAELLGFIDRLVQAGRPT